MQTIHISESGIYSKNISYLLEQLTPKLEFCGAKSAVRCNGERTVVTVNAESCYNDFLRYYLIDIISDILCISYKQEQLMQSVQTYYLSDAERRLLLSALIAADLPEEREYVKERLKEEDIFQFDGFFRFKLPALSKKWDKVSRCIPAEFNSAQLDEFLRYILEENEITVYLKDGTVYDDSYRELARSKLLSETGHSFREELLLSGAKKVVCLANVSDEEEAFLAKYYKEHVFFA